MWNQQKGWGRCCLLLLAGVASFQVVAGAVPDLQEVLRSMKSADGKYCTHSISAEYRIESEVTAQPGKTISFINVTTRKDEATGRFEAMSVYREAPTATSEALSVTAKTHRLFTGEKAFDHGVTDKHVVFVSKQPRGFVADNEADTGGELLKGTVGSVKPVWDVVAEQGKARVLEALENVGGCPCLVLKSSGPYGEVTVWVDEAHDYVIRRLVVRKGRDSLSYGGIELNKYPDATSEWEFSLDNVEVESIEGHYVPVGGTLKERHVSKEGIRASTEDIKLTSINFHPDFAAEGAFQLDVPDGTEVWDMDVQGLKYRWEKGELIPMVDAKELNALKRTTEQMVRAKDSPETVQPQEVLLPAASKAASTRGESGFVVRTVGSIALAVIGCVLLLIALRNRTRDKASGAESRKE